LTKKGKKGCAVGIVALLGQSRKKEDVGPNVHQRGELKSSTKKKEEVKRLDRLDIAEKTVGRYFRQENSSVALPPRELDQRDCRSFQGS